VEIGVVDWIDLSCDVQFSSTRIISTHSVTFCLIWSWRKFLHYCAEFWEVFV
jgi:hypothetical protein